MEDRRKYLRKAKTALAHLEGIRLVLSEGSQSTVLRRGSFGDVGRELQERLADKGFALSIDAQFGAATELAVLTFQRNHGLIPDGIIGKKLGKH